jgi:NADPH-dependent curcumin reductase CurA
MVDDCKVNLPSPRGHAVLPNMRHHGRIPTCGMILQYNLQQEEVVRNLFHIITKRVRMEGFVVFDYFSEYFVMLVHLCGLTAY